MQETQHPGPRAEIADLLATKTKDGEYKYAIVLSKTGELLKTISKFRPNVTILGVSPDKKLWTSFGVWHSIFMNKVDTLDNLDNNIEKLSEIAKSWGAKLGEKVLVVRSTAIKEIEVI
ncbi:hypothetical protein Mccp14020TZ_02750 [Mycoplasma capricolum subsp. capripneumoniae]|nr:hypothetical protein Mccp14020TZ_02750 [Mycoplasma capricolum subsp. capripneumoniae]